MYLTKQKRRRKAYLLLAVGFLFPVLTSQNPAGIRLTVQPTFSRIGSSEIDGLALLYPWPEIQFLDSDQQETLSMGSKVMAGLCYDGYLRGPTPAVCRCADVNNGSLVRRSYPANTTTNISNLSAIPTRANCDPNSFQNLFGNSSLAVNQSKIRFQNLRTWVALRNLRIFFTAVIQDSNFTIFSEIFSINPGPFEQIKVVQELADQKGCPRCPFGTHIAGNALYASVALQDKFNNTLEYNCINQTQCSLPAPKTVIMEYLRRNRELFAIQVVSEAGIANFSNFTVFDASVSLSLSFSATLIGNQGPVATIQTRTFTVTNSKPFKPRAFLPGVAIISNNGSVLPPSIQPKVEILDFFDNSVLSDCYLDSDQTCKNSIALECSADKDDCSQPTLVQINTRQAVLVGNQISNRTSEGVAQFTDLGVFRQDAACESLTVQLRFSLLGSLETAEKSLQIEPGVQKLVVIEQPPSALVANQIFPTPVQLQAVDCRGIIASNIIAHVDVQLINAPSQNVLRGTTTAQASLGFFEFDDLSIYVPGTLYSLKFIYGGLTYVPPLISATFQVLDPPSAIQILQQPSALDPSQPTTAGRVFLLQPKLRLVPAMATTMVVSAMTAPGWEPGSLQWHDPGRSDVLSGTLYANFGSDGIAIFTDLVIKKASLHQGLAAENYRLRFTSKNLQVDSLIFTISPAEWSGLFIPEAKEPKPSIATFVFVTQPAVCLVDRFLNLIDQATDVPVSAKLLGGPPQTVLMHCNGLVVCTSNSACIDDACRRESISGIAKNSFVQFTDLGITSTGSNYQLMFFAGLFNVTSIVFPILPGNINSLAISNISAISSADGALQIQPHLRVLDLNGNIVDMPSDSQIRYYLRTKSGSIATISIPLVDLIPDSVCLAPSSSGDLSTPASDHLTILENSSAVLSEKEAFFTNLTVRRVMNDYTLQFSLQSLAGIFTANTTRFSISPGVAQGICTLTLPSLCAVLAPCLQAARVVCVDKYGNVQPSCERCPPPGCKFGSFINTSVVENVKCPTGNICVELYSGPLNSGLSQYFQEAHANVSDCSGAPCPAKYVFERDAMQQGSRQTGAIFTDLVMNVSSQAYKLKFFTYTTHPKTLAVEEWSYVTQNIVVQPPPPMISEVVFTASMDQIQVIFGEETNMNIILGESDDTSCVRELEKSFLDAVGRNPFCAWPNPSVLTISLGEGAYVDNTTRFYLNPESRIIAKPIGTVSLDDLQRLQDALLPCSTVEGSILAGRVVGRYFPNLPPVLPIPIPRIVLSDFNSACDLFSADARLSSGNAHRPFESVNWGIDYPSTRLRNGILQSGRSYRMIKARAYFSSRLPADSNTITITLMFNAPVLPGTNFRLSGLTGYFPSEETVSSGIERNCLVQGSLCHSVSILGNYSSLFSYSAVQWVVEKSIFVFQVNVTRSLPALEDIVLVFKLLNPPSFVPASPVLISSAPGNGSGICLDPESITCFRHVWYSFPQQQMEMDCARLCRSEAVFEIADREITLRSGNIRESTKVNRVINELTLLFTPSSDLPPGSLVILGGFSRDMTQSSIFCLRGRDAEHFACADCQVDDNPDCSRLDDFPSTASWDPAGGEISFIVRAGHKISSSTATEIAFNVRNPQQTSRQICSTSLTSCPSLTKVTIRFSIARYSNFKGTAAVLNGDVMGGGEQPRFDAVQVFESNTLSGFPNFLYFNFSANINIPPGTSITISGLVGLDPKSDIFLFFGTPCLPSRKSLGRISSFADQSSFVVQVPNQCWLHANSVVSFAAYMLNPLVPAHSMLSLSAVISGCSMCIESCLCFKSDLPQIVVPASAIEGSVLGGRGTLSISPVLMHVNTFVSGQESTVTMSVTCTASLNIGSNFTIQGLEGTVSPEITVYDSYNVPYTAMATIGMIRNTSQFTFEIQTVIPANSIVFFNFSQRNGLNMQNWSKVTVSGFVMVMHCDPNFLSACGFPSFNMTDASDVAMIAATPIEIPGQILMDGTPGLSVASISSLTNVAAAYNVLTVKIVLNIAVEGSGTLTISGLDAFVAPDPSDTIVIKANVLQLIPNCSCNADLELVTEECTGCLDSDKMIAAWQPDGLFGSGNIQGTWGNGLLSIPIVGGVEIPPEKTIIFAFLVKNPSAPGIINCNISLMLDPSYIFQSIPLIGDLSRVGSEKPAFGYFSVAASNLVSETLNRITIQFAVNCPLTSFSSVLITISGFSGFQTGNGYIPLYGISAYSVSRLAAGQWSQSSGQIVLSGGTIVGSCPDVTEEARCQHSASLDANRRSLLRYEFSFFLQNPVAVNDGVRTLRISAVADDILIPMPALGSAKFPEIGPIASRPAFQSADVFETTKVRGLRNQISLQFATSMILYPNSTITISGFDGSLTQENAFLPLGGPDAYNFAQGRFVSGQVILSLLGETEAGKIVSVNFTLINAPSIRMVQRFPTITGRISAKIVCSQRKSCASFTVSYYNVFGYPSKQVTLPSMTFGTSDFFSANIVPAFVQKAISESTKVNFAINTITVVLTANVLLPELTDITIAGLFPASSFKPVLSKVNLDGPSASLFSKVGYMISCNDITSFPTDSDFSPTSDCLLSNSERKLKLTINTQVSAGTNMTFSLKLPNGHAQSSCCGACDANCRSFPSKVSASGRNSIERNLLIPLAQMQGTIFEAGAELSWVVKNVAESTGAKNAMNKITIRIRPNAPLYGGTQISISGLNLTLQKSGMKCFPKGDYGDMIPGLGCSDLTRARCRSTPLCSDSGDKKDIRCTPQFQANPEFQNMVYYPCLPIFDETVTESSLFVIPTTFQKGILSATVEVGQMISELEDTSIVIMLRNTATRQPYGAEYQCLDNEISGVHCGSKTLPGLSIQTATSKLCDSNQNQMNAEGCNPSEWNCVTEGGTTTCTLKYVSGITDISTTSIAVDHHNLPLRDRCPTCIRQSDLVDFDRVLQEQHSLVIPPIMSGMQNRAKLPSLIAGGLASGSYNIILQLSNWIGAENTGGQVFVQIDRDDVSTFSTDGLGGALGDEVSMPSVIIRNVKDTSIFIDQSLQMDCMAAPATCIQVTNTANLIYSWRKGNQDAVIGREGTYIIPAYSLNASSVTIFSCQVQQGSMLSLKASLAVTTKLRDLFPMISGVSNGSSVSATRNLKLSGYMSFDPENQTTKLLSPKTDFTFNWGCQVLNLVSNTFDACLDGQLANNSGMETSISTDRFQIGDRIRIKLSVSRGKGGFSTGTSFRTVEFTTQENPSAAVLVLNCDPNIGFSEPCYPLVRARSNAGDSIVLQATLSLPLSQKGQVISQYQWSIPDPYDGKLSASMALTSMQGSVLVLKPGSVVTGRPITFQVSVTDNFDTKGIAQISVVVNVPPFGGGLEVTPSSGTSLQTTFELKAMGWTTDPESLPLTYSFHCVYEFETVLSAGPETSAFTFLPTGDRLKSFAQTVVLTVSDTYGGITRTSVGVVVNPAFGHSISYLNSLFDIFFMNFLNAGNLFGAQVLITSLISVINDAQISCMISDNVLAGQCTIQDECCQRRTFRNLVLKDSSEVFMSFSPSAQFVNNQASLLRSLTAQPVEMDLNLLPSCSSFLLWSLTTALRTPKVDIAQLSTVYLGVVDNLMKSLSLNLEKSSRLLPTGRDHRLALNAPVLPIRTLISELFDSLIQISALSVKDSKPGQSPAMIFAENSIIYTTRIYLSQVQGDVTLSINGTTASATIPKVFFNGIDATENDAVDIMLAISFALPSLLPACLGPVVILDARTGRVGSAFTPYKPPPDWGGIIDIKLPFAESANEVESEIADPITGRKEILYGKYFDVDSWTWKIATQLTRTETYKNTLFSSTGFFGVFAVNLGFRGCDGVDVSPKIRDACGVCNGNNGTCSGCDGIPHTGRSKNCSGHGSCEGDTCLCVNQWFGIMCETVCRDEIECSGHGLCLGTFCSCLGAYSSKNISYPGPFCDQATNAEQAAAKQEAAKQADSEKTKNLLITIVTPAVGGAIVAMVLLCLLYTRRARQLKKFAKTVLDFPQPQLNIPAERRDHEAIMTPDESGWSNVEFLSGKLHAKDDEKWVPKGLHAEADEGGRIKASAAYSFGPNSGQLVSAIAASTRANVGEMSTETIERRVRNLRSQINARQTVSKHRERGPEGSQSASEDFKDDHSNSDGSDDKQQDGNSNFFGRIMDPPEWLSPRSGHRS